jgi:hypothetical protein
VRRRFITDREHGSFGRRRPRHEWRQHIGLWKWGFERFPIELGDDLWIRVVERHE